VKPKIKNQKSNNSLALSLPMEGGSEVKKFEEAKKYDSDRKSPTDCGNSEREFFWQDLGKIMK